MSLTKRPAEDFETDDTRNTKVARKDEDNKKEEEDDPRFPKAALVPFAKIKSVLKAGSIVDEYIEGRVEMVWLCDKFSLACPNGNGNIEVTIPGLESKCPKVGASFEAPVKLSLQGAKCTNTDSSSTEKRKVKLLYEHGFLMQISPKENEVYEYDHLAEHGEWDRTPPPEPQTNPALSEVAEPNFSLPLPLELIEVAEPPAILHPEAPLLKSRESSAALHPPEENDNRLQRYSSTSDKTLVNHPKPNKKKHKNKSKQAAALPHTDNIQASSGPTKPKTNSIPSTEEVEKLLLMDCDSTDSGAGPSTIGSSALGKRVRGQQSNMKKRDARNAAATAAAQSRGLRAGLQTQYCTYPALNKLKPLENYEKTQVVGLVVGYVRERQTSNLDWSCKVGIIDPSFNQTNNILEIKAFSEPSCPHLLPAVKNGQVIIVRGMTVKNTAFSSNLEGVLYKNKLEWAIYDSQSAKITYNGQNTPSGVKARPQTFYQPKVEELEYMYNLSEWWKASKRSIMPRLEKALSSSIFSKEEGSGHFEPPSNAAASNVQQHSLGNLATAPVPVVKKGLCPIRDVTPGTFFDCVVWVEHIWRAYDDGRKPPELYVTDYTRNTLLPSTQCRGPGNHRTLKISLWDAAREAGKMLEPGFYRFKGLQAKLDRMGAMEARMSFYKVDKLATTFAAVQTILRRKAMVEKDPNWDDTAETLNNGSATAPPDKSAAAHQKAEAPSNEPSHSLDTRIISRKVSEVDELSDDDEEERATHPFVSNNFADIAEIDTISEVLSVTEFPRKFRVEARIKDYTPRNFEDWVTAYCTTCKEELPQDHLFCTGCFDDMKQNLTYFYRFAFLIEDRQQNELVVTMTGDAAQKFLRDLPVRPLRGLPSAIKALKNYVQGVVLLRSGEVELPYIDICIGVFLTDCQNAIYTMFGCELIHKSADA